MGTLFTIALRNVARHKRRTLITAFVMTFGIAVFIMFDSMLSGMDRITIDTMIDYSASSVKVRTVDYLENLSGTPLEHGLADPAAVEAAAMAAGAAASARRTAFVARLSNYVDALPVMAYAIDPERDAAVFALPASIDEGSWFPGGEANEIALGSKLAEELGLTVGDYVVLSARTTLGNDNADEFLVVATLNAPDPSISAAGAYISFAAGESLLDLHGLVTEVDVALPRAASLDGALSQAEEAAVSMRAALPGLEVQSIRELASDYLAMRAMKSKFSYVIILMVLLIAAVGIVNTILMAVYARVREIGVLRAYGMLGKDVRRLFTIEGILVGVIGASGGVALGALVVWYLTAVGIPVGAMVGDLDMGNIPLTGMLYGQWNPATMLSGFLFGVFVAFIAARIPAKRAAKLEVTDALRFV